MSHAEARVRLADGTVLFAEYDGTTDHILPQLFRTREELRENWRAGDDDRACTCGQDEAAEYAHTYANGGHGPVRACRHCLAITDVSAWVDAEIDDMHFDPMPGAPAWLRGGA